MNKAMMAIIAALIIAAPAYALTFTWEYDDEPLIAYYSLFRAYPDSISYGFARVDTSSTREITIDIPDSSIVYVTAIDTMGRESKPSPTLDLTKLPPAPANMRAVIRFEMEVR